MTLAAPMLAPPLEERDARRGVLMMVIGIALFSLLNGVVKSLAETFAVNQIIFFRNLLALVTLALMARSLGGMRALAVNNPKGMALQAAQFTGVLVFAFIGYRHLPLADATAISFLQPLLVMVLCAPLLGEKVTRHGWFALALGLAGVSLLVQPTGSGSAYGVMMSLAAALFGALSLIQQRSLSRRDTSLSIVFWTLAGSALIVLPTLPLTWVWPSPALWAVLILNGLASGFCQYLTTRAVWHAPVATLAPLKYTMMVYAVVIGFVWFGDVPGLMVIIGSALVIGASLIAYLAPAPAPRPQDATP